MFRSIKEWIGYEVQAVDGKIGKIDDYYFDEKEWIICYVVVDVGDWIKDRKVLITPEEFREPDEAIGHFSLKRLTKEQIKNSPDVDTALPVSKQDQLSLHKYYVWPPYSVSPVTTEVKESDKKKDGKAETVEQMRQDYVNLRSAREVIQYTVKGKDGEVGKVDDLLLDDEAWALVYLVVDSKDKLKIEKKILLTMSWIKWIHYRGQEIQLDLNKQTIFDSPPYDQERTEKRSFEKMLYHDSSKSYLWVQK